jgi:WD40 repeat protein
MQILNAHFRNPELVRLVFSPDGRYLAAGDNRILYVWDLAAGSKHLWYRVCILSRGFVFAPDGTAIVGGYEGSFQQYDVRTGDEVYVPFLGRFNPSQFSQDGRFALAATSEPEYEVGPDWQTGRLTLRAARNSSGTWAEAWQRELYYHPCGDNDPGYSHLVFSTAGQFVVRVHPYGRTAFPMPMTHIVLLDTETGSDVRVDPNLRQWRGELPKSPSKAAAGPTGVTAFLKGRNLYAVDSTKVDASAVKRVNASTKHFTDLAFSHDGTRLATTSNDTAATIWDATIWEVRRRYAWDIGRLRVVCFASDGLRCAAASDTGRIVVWDLDD